MDIKIETLRTTSNIKNILVRLKSITVFSIGMLFVVGGYAHLLNNQHYQDWLKN